MALVFDLERQMYQIEDAVLVGIGRRARPRSSSSSSASDSSSRASCRRREAAVLPDQRPRGREDYENRTPELASSDKGSDETGRVDSAFAEPNYPTLTTNTTTTATVDVTVNSSSSSTIATTASHQKKPAQATNVYLRPSASHLTLPKSPPSSSSSSKRLRRNKENKCLPALYAPPRTKTTGKGVTQGKWHNPGLTSGQDYASYTRDSDTATKVG